MSATPTTSTGGLHRRLDNRVIAGVCSGLADYFNIDPVLVRVAFVVAAFAGGASILAYIILWIVMPPSAAGSGQTGAIRSGNQAALWVGGSLVLLGILFLVGNTGIFWWWNWSVFWPLVLVALGVLIVSRRAGGH